MAQFTNQATLFYKDIVTNSNITVGRLVEVLSATKTAINDRYRVGDDVTFVINIVNTGTVDHTGLSVSDNLGAYLWGGLTLYPLTFLSGSVHYYQNGMLQPNPAVQEGPALVVTGVTAPAHGNATLIYQAAVNSFAPLRSGGTIVNQASVSGSGMDPLVVTAVIHARDGAQLTISKTLCPAAVTAGGAVSYTFVMQNSGNSAATVADNVVLSNTFRPSLCNLAVTYNGADWSQPANYTYCQTTGAFCTAAGQITVPAAAYTRETETGRWVVNPGFAILVVSGTV